MKMLMNARLYSVIFLTNRLLCSRFKIQVIETTFGTLELFTWCVCVFLTSVKTYPSVCLSIRLQEPRKRLPCNSPIALLALGSLWNQTWFFSSKNVSWTDVVSSWIAISAMPLRILRSWHRIAFNLIAFLLLFFHFVTQLLIFLSHSLFPIFWFCASFEFV